MYRHPVVHVFLMLAALSALFAAAPVMAQVTTLTLGVDKPSPQLVGTSLTFTATASGGSGPYEYKFWIAKGSGAYVQVTPDYAAETTMVWTPTEPDSYKVMVYARTQGSTVVYEKNAIRSGYYVVAEAPLTAVTIGASKPSPQQVGTPLIFTAVASGGGGSGPEYQFWLARGGGEYRLVKDYIVAGNTWTPGAGDMDVADSYVVKVNARNVGSIAPFEKFATMNYVTMTDVPVKSVTLTADKESPQDLSTAGTVTFTAVATPGLPDDEVEYRFWLYSGATAKYAAVGDVTTDYSAANTWHWTPAAAGDYKVMVYARTVGTSVAYEKLKVVLYSVFAVPPILGEVTPSVLSSPVGSAQTLSAVYSDEGGYAKLKIVSLLINEAESEANGIYARYDRALGKLYLVDDAGVGYVGNCVPGSAGTLSNSQGMLNCASTTVGGSGNDLTVNWSITPKASFVSATAKNIFTHAKDTANVQAGWADKGDWTIISGYDLTDCDGCHGSPSHAGFDGSPGTADDAPNVLGNNSTWGYNVNGHGAKNFDPDGSGPLGTRAVNCPDCHDLATPSPGTHLNGVFETYEFPGSRFGGPNANTSHLVSAYFGTVGNEKDWQVNFDNNCYRNIYCHKNPPARGHRHEVTHRDGVVRFGDNLTVVDPKQSRPSPFWTPWTIGDLSTDAPPPTRHYAPCVACHDPHGADYSGYTDCRLALDRNYHMVRNDFCDPVYFCNSNCHRR